MSADPLYVYSNSTNNTGSMEAPYLNYVSGTIPNDTYQSVGVLSSTFITDNNSGGAVNYFKAILTFQLFGAILTSAPAANSGTGGQPPQLNLTIPNIGNGNTPQSYWMVDLMLSAGGRDATTATFQTAATGTSGSSGTLTFVLTNYFNISSPGVVYKITVEGCPVNWTSGSTQNPFLPKYYSSPSSSL